MATAWIVFHCSLRTSQIDKLLGFFIGKGIQNEHTLKESNSPLGLEKHPTFPVAFSPPKEKVSGSIQS